METTAMARIARAREAVATETVVVTTKMMLVLSP
jgi:hypothetical protein